MTNPAFNFTRAITRMPSDSVVNGLRAEDIGTPDFGQLFVAHADYILALKRADVEVTELDPADDFPDAVFVEDTTLCLPQGAVLLRPAAPSRAGEVAQIAAAVRAHFDTVSELEGPGHVEGGDILFTGREVLVGRSARTDAAGIEELRKIVTQWGHTLREIAVPDGVLHFKTDCSLLDAETVLSTKRLADSGCFDGYRVLHAAEGEEAAANAIRVNDVVIFPADFPRTAEMLQSEGYQLIEVDNSQFAKLDGGMSCLSLRF